MNLVPFLRELRAMLTPVHTWHPFACANREGFVLSEYAQAIPGGPMVPTWNLATAWNLPCAITRLLGEWEHRGAFVDVPIEKTALRHAVVCELSTEAQRDLWTVTTHAEALRVLDATIGAFADKSAA